MSYRDLRNFTEMMKALGYSRLISMENFRNPNFPLIAEILIWLAKRFEPDADIPSEFDTEIDRVILIRSVCQFMASKANIKLNTKRLYQADGYAVKELLKVTAVLYDALQVNVTGNDEEPLAVTDIDIGSKINELKRARLLASEITVKGATLYDLLGKETEIRDIRNMQVNRQLEMSEIESSLKKSMKVVEEEISKTKEMMNNVSASEASLDSKIEKKKVELERNTKRLQTLKKVRPAFLEEFERLEVELRQLYDDYLLRYRCLAYLEQQQEESEQVEQERMEERQASTKKFLEQMKQEEKLFEVSGELFGDLKEENEEVSKPMLRKTSSARIKSTAGAMRKATGQRRVYGGMVAPDEDDSGSLDSDSDLLLDGDGSGLGSDDEDELELGPITDERPEKSNSRLVDHSDDDF